MNPALIASLVFGLATVLSLCFWWQQRTPRITSSALLMRAEVWDPVALHNSAPGVIRQTVEIMTPKRTLKRTIYRDARGKRKPLDVELPSQEDLLKKELAIASVAWDAPLSAASYQGWHDAQRVRADRVRRAEGDLLVLTTTTPEGAVAAESLTVRDTDFHPVRRTVSFRDSETVEIAELDYSVLPWTPTVSGLFQPEEEMRLSDPTRPQPALIPFPPRPLTDSELDNAELSARLTLDRLHADTGEQIEVDRGPHGIEVRGITDTEERRRELEAQLDMLPHVTTMISSLEEMRREQAQGAGEITGVKVASAQSQATPLEIYYLAHERSVASLGHLSQQLLNGAFVIAVESRAIDELEHRFTRRDGISLVASAALSDLLFTHKHRLLTAIDDEEHLLSQAQIGIRQSASGAPAAGTSRPLTVVAERNLALARELALSNGAGERPAESIASELAVCIDELYRHAYAVQVVPPNSTSLDTKK